MTCQACQFDHPDAVACECGAILCPYCRGEHECVTVEAPLWRHQERGLAEYRAAVDAGDKAICITSPTGGGKTRIMTEILAEAASHYQRVAIYTNRKLLRVQISGALNALGLDHGVMAAGHDPALLRDVQVASFQTVKSRVYDKERWDLHEADIVIVDEAHGNMNPTALQIIGDHQKQDATLVGFTATPVSLGSLYKRLIVAGTNSELRQCGALVPCTTYGPDEPDLKHVKRHKAGEYVQDGMSKAIMVQSIFGRVYEWWRKLNPDGKPTILFAPGVKESRWFVEDLARRGVTAAHIDADTPPEERQEIIEGSREGRIQVVCNRYVLREGINMPWLAHCIMATAFGALSNFLQAGGRLLRAYPGLDQVTLQCHGGSWHRFGSLNQDRVWTLDDTDKSIAAAQKKRREQGEPEPICCPKCGGVRMTGPKCPFCGHQHKLSVRIVVQKNGDLKHQRGRVTKQKRPVGAEQKQWDQCFYAAANSRNGMTFDQAAGMYFHKHHSRPPGGLKNMPEGDSLDWQRRVSDVYPWAVRKRRQPQPVS